MKIRVKVKPNSSKQSVESFGDNRYLVHVKSAPENNEANVEVMKLLSKELGVPATALHITFGKTGHDKIIEVKF